VIFATMLVTAVLAQSTLDQQIDQEVDHLLALHVDVRPVDAGTDARADYTVIARQIRQRAPAETIFRSLEQATQKPTAFFIRSQQGDKPFDKDNERVIVPIDGWVQDHAEYWAKTRNWPMVERLYRFEKRFKEQLYACGSSIFGRWLPDANVPMGYLIRKDATTRKWLRQKTESFDLQGMVAAKLSRFGRFQRKLKGNGFAPLVMMGTLDLNPKPEPIPVWQKAEQTDPLFHKKGELALLRQLTALAPELISQTFVQLEQRDLGKLLWNRLDLSKDLPSQWAKDHIEARYYDDNANTEFWNETLIELDLRESRDAGTPLVPTWSRKYCVDPHSGAPIKVRANRSGFSMSCRTANSEWHDTTKW
jgi:hypothetical protein